jgi:hypothetical protein
MTYANRLFVATLILFAGLLIAGESALAQDPCPGQMPGDLNSSGDINIQDFSYLVSYLYGGGPPPPVAANADVDGDCCVDTADVVYLAATIFQGGPPPVDCTCDQPPICPDSCAFQFPGDFDGNGAINVDDFSGLVSWLYSGGPGPANPANADVNGSCCIDTADIVALADYLCWPAAMGMCRPPCPILDIEMTGDVDNNGSING